MEQVQEFVSLAPWTLIFQICNLLLLMLLLKKFLFKPVQNILNRRRQELDDIYAEANADRDAAREMKAEYTQHMADARAEADAVVQRAMDEAGRKSDAMLSDAQEAAAYMKRKAQADIEAERRGAYASLRNDISGMAVDIAEKVVGREINAEDQQALIEDFLKNAGDNK